MLRRSAARVANSPYLLAHEYIARRISIACASRKVFVAGNGTDDGVAVGNRPRAENAIHGPSDGTISPCV